MKKGSFILLFLFYCMQLIAQVTAQGQGGKLVYWQAVGLEQTIGKKWTNRNVLAYSRKSTMDSWNPFELPGVITIREEVDYRFSKRFKLSSGLLYAQRYYHDETHPSYIHEFRFYPKIYHLFQVGNIQFSHYVRTDFRWFYQPSFTVWHKPFEFRTRYLMKMNVPLDKRKKSALVFMTEFLAATDEEIASNGRKKFTRFRFTENRSSLFYRYHFQQPEMFFDIGLMNQMWRSEGETDFHQTLLIQLDWIFVDIFKRKRK